MIVTFESYQYYLPIRSYLFFSIQKALRGFCRYFHLAGSRDPFKYTPQYGRWSSRYCVTDCWHAARTRRCCARGPVCDAPGADRAPVRSRDNSFRGFCERLRETRDWNKRRSTDSKRCWNSLPRTPPLPPLRRSRTSRTEQWWYTYIKQTFIMLMHWNKYKAKLQYS